MNEAKKTALLLVLSGVLLLLTLTSADEVGTYKCGFCPNWGEFQCWIRVRDYPTDENATFMRLRKCDLTALNPDDVANLPNLDSLDLGDNHIAEINLTILKNFPKLRSLYLEVNDFRKLDTFPEGSCWELTELDLRLNKLTYIKDDTFSACTKLRYINLEHNLLTHIHPDVFSTLTELKHLNLNDNQLTFITTRMFINNIQLETLNLDGNRLSFLPANFATTLRLAPNAQNVLESFDVLQNPWECGCLLEYLADAKNTVVTRLDDFFPHAELKRDGKQSACVFIKAAPCDRRPPSGFYPAPGALKGLS